MARGFLPRDGFLPTGTSPETGFAPDGHGGGFMPDHESAATWEPPDATSATCLLWLRADLGITLVSDKVSVWADQGGSGNDFSQANAALRLDYALDVQNGRPAVANTAASGKYLTRAAFLSGTDSAEAFFVIQSLAAAGVTNGFCDFGSNGVSSVYPYEISDAIYDGFGSTTRPNTVADSSAFVRNVHIYNPTAGTPNHTVRVNNSVVYDAAHTRGWAADFKIGESFAGALNFHGYIFEVVVYDGPLSAGDRALFYTYANAGWAI